jgi:CBS domain-containing protein
MNIAEITTRFVPTITPGTSLQAAAASMRMAQSGILPVVEQGQLVGTLSEHDLVLKGYADGLDPLDAVVEQVYDSAPIVCTGDFHLKAALELMQQRQSTWLLVTGEADKIVGVVSLVELLDLLEQSIREESDGPEPNYVKRVRGEAAGG